MCECVYNGDYTINVGACCSWIIEDYHKNEGIFKEIECLNDEIQDLKKYSDNLKDSMEEASILVSNGYSKTLSIQGIVNCYNSLLADNSGLETRIFDKQDRIEKLTLIIKNLLELIPEITEKGNEDLYKEIENTIGDEDTCICDPTTGSGGPLGQEVPDEAGP